MKLTLGYSPCPNDCFIFDALIHNKIDTEGMQFEVRLEDVETLNQKAMQGYLDITKLSYHAYAYVLDKYILLRAGSALGFNCGPILIQNSKFKIQNSKNAIQNSKLKIQNSKTQNIKYNIQDRRYKTQDFSACKVAIPGKLTTANLLLSIAYPHLTNKKEYFFSEIENVVLRGEVDAGLIIHENRFTYQDKGLEKIIDLGEYWDSLIHAPIPLGGIVIKRNLDSDLQQKVNRLIQKSVEYAFANPESCMDYVKAHAQEMSEEVMKKHIALYVNNFSIDLGETGINAVKLLFEKAQELNLFKFNNQKLVID